MRPPDEESGCRRPATLCTTSAHSCGARRSGSRGRFFTGSIPNGWSVAPPRPDAKCVGLTAV